MAGKGVQPPPTDVVILIATVISLALLAFGCAAYGVKVVWPAVMG